MRTLYIAGFFVLGFALTMTPVLGPSPLRFSVSLMEPEPNGTPYLMILASPVRGEGLSPPLAVVTFAMESCASPREPATALVNAGVIRAKEWPGGGSTGPGKGDPCLRSSRSAGSTAGGGITRRAASS